MPIQQIMLIEDDQDDQDIFFTALAKIPHPVKCETYADAQQALDILKKGNTSPELIFLDMNMPAMSGHQFLALIKNEPLLKEIPIIIFTTSSHNPTKLLMIELGALDFITKPDEFDALVTILNKKLVFNAD
jgi:CheY-like chemotaxis protein